MIVNISIIAIALLVMTATPLLHIVHALDNGVGLTPPMGWTSRDAYGCNVNEVDIRNAADALVKLGLADAGYTYLSIDDCWAVSRDNASRLVPDPNAFPSGMYALGDYLHERGLRFGLYSSPENTTCSGRPGSLNYEAIDAITFAAWGVDHLKYSDCGRTFAPQQLYSTMGAALNWTGRPIYFAMDDDGDSNPATWAGPTVNSWHTAHNDGCTWDDVSYNIDMNDRWVTFGGPGHWNDADTLEVGSGCLTYDEEVTQFSWWAIVKSPLFLAANVASIPLSSLSILLNTEMIAINQDPLGAQAGKLSSVNGSEVWSSALTDGAYVVMLVNRQDNVTATILANFTQVGFTATQQVIVRDLWRHKALGIFTGGISATLAPHASVTLKLIPTPPNFSVDDRAALNIGKIAEDDEVYADARPFAVSI